MQLKDTLNGNIHDTISFPFNLYIVSSPICHGSSYHQDHCYSPWQIVHRSWFKWDCEKLYRDQILWDISRGITTDCWWYQRPLYWVQHLTPFLPKQTLKGEARGCRDDIKLFLRPKFEFKWCWTFFPQDGPMISLSYMKHNPVARLLRKVCAFLSLEITSLHEKVCVTFLLIPAPLSPLYILKVSLDPQWETKSVCLWRFC